MKCPTCGSEMRELLTSVYCPNEERHTRSVHLKQREGYRPIQPIHGVNVLRLYTKDNETWLDSSDGKTYRWVPGIVAGGGFWLEVP